MSDSYNTESPDAELVAFSIAGEEEAYRILVERYVRLAGSIAYARVGDVDIARDVAQDGLCDAYINLRRLRDRTKFGPWLAGIIRRKAIGWVRSKVRSKIEFGSGREDYVASGTERPIDVLSHEESTKHILDAVHGLPPHYREVIVLRCLDGMSPAEIRTQLGISVAALDKRLSRAKDMLREVLDGAE